MFRPVDTKTALAKQEEQVLAFWKDNQVLEQSIKDGATRPVFSFYDGPPFATGLPHYGHLLVGTIKDAVLRYKAMHGYQVSRRFGWDCHGLPVENEIEKAKGISGAAAVEKFGIGNFNEECRNIVLRYTEEWKSSVSRFGRWVDFNDVYKTMDPSFMESVWWVFSQLWNKGLIYEGCKVMPYSAKLGTPLSNFEASENYKDVEDPALTIACELEEDPGCSLLVWTTTPWTLVSNLAIIVHPDVEYSIVEHPQSGKRYILATQRIPVILKDHADWSVVGKVFGRELAGKRYKPMFPYFLQMKQQGAFTVIVDEFVQVTEGTGLVHGAPGFGEVDFYACKKAGIPVVCPVDQNGKFTDEILPYVGRFVKDCDGEIIKELQKMGKLVLSEKIVHRYPFCWRSDTPLIYKAVSTWFVAVEKIKDKLLNANEQIRWVPDHLKHGRFGKWLENARDWAISRNRYWGTPIPVWRSDDGDVIVVESRAQLAELTGENPADIHRHFIDHLTITKNGRVYRRIPEVFDCWFESGSMPYAQYHYPFENQERFEKEFPAEFIAEALDQTRGWFYTLTVLSSALYDKPAFRNVIVNGIVLAEDGQKMSKRLRNYPDPLEVVSRHGADAVRVYMLASPAVHAEDLCFSEKGVELTLRQLLLPLWNSVSFFVTYANMYGWKPSQENKSSQDELDRWIISMVESLIQNVETAMEQYDVCTAVSHLLPFVDHLTNWYIRRSRRRFWSDEDSQDRRDAFATLYYALTTFTKVAAPFMPFTSELVWQILKTDNDPLSVHFLSYPSRNASARDVLLEEAQSAAQEVVKLVHALRKNLKIKVRQPLSKAFIVTPDQTKRKHISKMLSIIAQEINVKEIVFGDDEHQFVSLKAKPNFRQLGKRIGHRMRAVQMALEHLPFSKLQEFLEKKHISIHLEEGGVVELGADDIEVVRTVREGVVAMCEDNMTVALEVALDEALLAEGFAREIVNKLNTMRREQGFNVSDRIHVVMQTTDQGQKWIEAWRTYIQEETLATRLEFRQTEGTQWDVNGENTIINIAVQGR